MTVIFQLDADLHRQAKYLAARQHLPSTSELIRRSIKRYCEEEFLKAKQEGMKMGDSILPA